MTQKVIELKNIKKLTRGTKKDLKTPLIIVQVFILCVIVGSNILYALRNFFNTTTFPINGKGAPYSDPSLFPYNLCPGRINTADDVSHPCFIVIKWLAQTLALSWISWRKMLLMNPKGPILRHGKKSVSPNWTQDFPYDDGDIMQLLYLLGAPLLIPAILAFGSIFSIVLTYCGSFGAKGGIFFTLLFTFFPPILLGIIAPLVAAAQVLHVLYVLLLKPITTSGGWRYILGNAVDYLVFPLIVFFIYLLVTYKIIIWPLGVPFAIVIGGFYIWKLMGGLRRGNKNILQAAAATVVSPPLPPLPPQPPGIKGVALG